MKRIGNLYEKIISIDNLYLADANAREGKTKSYGVKWHDRRKDDNLKDLHLALKNKTFRTSEYDIFTINEGKERTIYRLPYYPDRIVHHAVMNILEPIWMSLFTRDTYACIKGRGIHGLARRLKRDIKDADYAKYALMMDIRKYYPSVDNNIMKSIVRKKIKCKDTLWLIDEIIDSAEGLPIGNYLSQYLANLYLAYFDHDMKEIYKERCYYRFVDNILIMHPCKYHLHYTKRLIEKKLKEEYKLDVKGDWQVFPIADRGIDLVGYVFYNTHTLMRKRVKKNFARKVAKLKKKGVTGKEFRHGVCAWTGWAKHCNSINLLKKLNIDEYAKEKI